MTSDRVLPATPREILERWLIGRVRSVRPTETGTNNASHLVEAESGAYFLRVHRNSVDHGRLDYEHALLRGLQGVGLSFAVPAPIVAKDGATRVAVAFDGRETIANLFPRIDGVHPERQDVSQTEICGHALGRLHVALGRIDRGSLPPGPAYAGDLAQVHPLVPDPVATIEGLPVAAERKGRVAEVFRRLATIAGDGLARLPRQIIHGDFTANNVLMVGGRVSGILDFEFVGEGIRAMDLASGLWSFGRVDQLDNDPWPPIEALTRGYRSVVNLSGDEIDALPDLLRLREATSLVHWVGRHHQGLTTVEDVAERVDRLLRLDERLHRDGPEMVWRFRSA